MYNHSYKGYTYCPEEEHEEDNRKIFHIVRSPDYKYLTLPLSPYTFPTHKWFDMWVDAGCPYPYSQRITEDELERLIVERELLNEV